MPEYLTKYREIQGWIPSTDVDEIDVAKNYVRDCSNVDFENGFIATAAAPTLVTLHANVITDIAAGYEILRLKYFYHSTQGDIWFYVLYKFSSPNHLLKFYVNNTLLNIDEQSSNVTFAAKPTNISFSLVNDQLKINLNINATYVGLTKTVIANLTLVYLDEINYETSVVTRNAGWYLFPRWVGWTFDENSIKIGTDVAQVEDAEDASYESWFSLVSGFTRSSVSPLTGSYSFRLDNSASGSVAQGIITISSVYNLKSIEFEIKSLYPGSRETSIEVTEISGSAVKTLATYSHVQKDSQKTNIEIELYYTSNTAKNITVYFVVEGGEDLRIDNFTINPMDDVYAVVKNYDGQRNRVAKCTQDFFNASVLSVKTVNIDWRIRSYEIYKRNSSDGFYYLLADIDLLDETPPVWTVNGAWYEADIVNIDTESDDYSIDTLVFNYGLGVTVRVDEQSYIYSEVFYHGRSYYTKNDLRVYHSHLSGTGKPQPDSFPYDEDLLFGYIITESGEINKALAVSLLDELIVYGVKKPYVYYIENAGGTPYRKVKAINGGNGVLNTDSVMCDFNGTPIGRALIWFNNLGVYAYTGGREAPINLLGLKLKNYWRTLTGKTSALGFYSQAKDEYWLQIGSDTLVYCFDTNEWRKYTLGHTILDFVGVKDGLSYYLTDDDKLYKIDPSSATKMSGYIEFHDDIIPSANPEISEIQAKVLHEVYIIWKQAISASNLAVLSFTTDRNLLSETMNLPVNLERYKNVSPYQITFGCLRLKLTTPALDVKLRELGFISTVLPIYETNIPV